jgi:hypothetical protein
MDTAVKKKRVRGPNDDRPKRGYQRYTIIAHSFALNNMKELSKLRNMTMTEAMEEAMKDWVIKKTARGWK